MNSKRTAIIHTALSVVAIVPSLALSIGLTIGAADANIGALGNVIAQMGGLFPFVLLFSVLAVWVAYVTRHPRLVQVAIAVPWSYLLVLLTIAVIAFGVTSQQGDTVLAFCSIRLFG